MAVPFELLLLLVMLAAFAGGVFVFKLPSGVALALSAVAGALLGGEGFPVRHLVEGSFGYLDALLIIATAMVFMKTIEATGALGTISHGIVAVFHRWPTVLMILICLFVMFPGMLTGLSSASILTTGAMVVPALLAMKMPRHAVGSLVAVMAVLGMIGPPVNIPVMIIGGGVDMPYVGFGRPLLLATVPVAVVGAVYYRVRYVRAVPVAEVLGQMPPTLYQRHGLRLFLPIAVVIGLIVAPRTFPGSVPDTGIPLTFVIGVLVGFGSGERFDLLAVSRAAIREALPVLAILVGVGMFVQVMTLTGVRGFLAVSALGLPTAALYVGVAVLMPAFGSAYAAASVLGVPLVYVFLGKNELVVASALSLVAGMGDLMPPPMLLCAFAAQMVGERSQLRILKESLPLIALSLLVGVAMIAFANDLARLL